MLLGEIKIVDQVELTSMPQKAASAWSAVEDLVGAMYKPIAYVGTQQVKGVNHWFIAEQTLLDAVMERNIVYFAINEFNGNFKVIPHTITKIDFEL